MRHGGAVQEDIVVAATTHRGGLTIGRVAAVTIAVGRVARTTIASRRDASAWLTDERPRA